MMSSSLRKKRARLDNVGGTFWGRNLCFGRSRYWHRGLLSISLSEIYLQNFIFPLRIFFRLEGSIPPILGVLQLYSL